ncbi:MAG: signal peptide peptidase SppA [Ignavibacteriales bacterium]|nr:signal peptide peptidase SppA [Ignavibacteriales bacterium]
MKQFFKFMFASMLGFFISMFLITLVIFVFMFAVISSLETEETVDVKDNSILEIKLDYELPERSAKDPSFNFGMIPSFENLVGLNDLLKSIKTAKNDKNIKGIFIDLDNFVSPGITKLSEIRNGLIDFKNSGKKIIAHGNSISEAGFYLASAADSIYLTPTGSMEFDGFGIELTFFKKTLDKLEIEPQIFQHGKFKSATEPFRVEQMSEENRVQLNKYLSSVFDKIISEISIDKKISVQDLKSISAKMKINFAEDAKKYRLVDNLKYEDEVDSVLAKIVNDDDNEFNLISFKKYFKAAASNEEYSNNRIAVIYADGEILESKGDDNSIGTENIIKALDEANNNDRVKAIVLRVNSPGGSALTSDMIWRKINLLKKEKPIIVSMSDLAASGGYYISCAANKIVAEPTSLTGSIGVFGIIPNAQKFFNEKLGITFDEVSTSENSGWATITKPLNNVQKKFIQNSVDRIYTDFVSRVASGRNMTFEQVDSIAQGRIWSGINAKEIGLVDTLGGINLALDIAAKSAEIEDYKIVEYPVQKETVEKIMEMFSSKIFSGINFSIFNEQLNQIEKLSTAMKYTGIQTRLPFEFKIN